MGSGGAISVVLGVGCYGVRVRRKGKRRVCGVTMQRQKENATRRPGM